jgi:predicted site-specific integrase-resolvase
MDDKSQPRFLTSKQACIFFNVKEATLRRWADDGIIDIIRNNTGQKFGHRRYDVNSYNKNKNKQQNAGKDIALNEPVNENKFIGKVCYCRVSSRHQKDDLERQIKFMQEKYPGYEIIKDIGSGINFKRPGLLRIINRAIDGNLTEVVVAYKDRLCRFGYDILECIFTKCNVTLLVLNNQDSKSIEQELSEDLLSIIHVFSCRSNGRRKYKTGKNTNEEIEENGEEINTV